MFSVIIGTRGPEIPAKFSMPYRSHHNDCSSAITNILNISTIYDPDYLLSIIITKVLKLNVHFNTFSFDKWQ